MRHKLFDKEAERVIFEKLHFFKNQMKLSVCSILFGAKKFKLYCSLDSFEENEAPLTISQKKDIKQYVSLLDILDKVETLIKKRLDQYNSGVIDIGFFIKAQQILKNLVENIPTFFSVLNKIFKEIHECYDKYKHNEHEILKNLYAPKDIIETVLKEAEIFRKKYLDLREKICLHNQRLVHNIVLNRLSTLAKDACGTFDYDDLLSAGNNGLLIAIDRFDPHFYKNKTLKFSTYAYWWIWQQIQKTISDNMYCISIPSHVKSQLSNLNKFMYKGTSLSKSEKNKLMRQLGLSPSGLQNLINLQNTVNVISIDNSVLDDEHAIYEIIEDKKQSPPDTNTEIKDEYEKVLSLMNNLSLREKYIFLLSEAIILDAPLTYQELSRIFRISNERVRQMIRETKKKLYKEYMNKTNPKDNNKNDKENSK